MLSDASIFIAVCVMAFLIFSTDVSTISSFCSYSENGDTDVSAFT